MSTSFHTSKIVVAKKQHQCDICSRHISVGEQYEKGAGFSQDFYTFKAHLYCLKYYNHIRIAGNYTWDEPLYFSDVAEAADYAGELHIYHDLIEQFSFGSGI